MAIQTIAAGPAMLLLLWVSPRYGRLGILGVAVVVAMVLYFGLRQLRLRRIARSGWNETSFVVTAFRYGPTVLIATDGTAIAVGQSAYRWANGRVTDESRTGAYARRGDRFAVFLDDRAERILDGRLPPPPRPG